MVVSCCRRQMIVGKFQTNLILFKSHCGHQASWLKRPLMPDFPSGWAHRHTLGRCGSRTRMMRTHHVTVFPDPLVRTSALSIFSICVNAVAGAPCAETSSTIPTNTNATYSTLSLPWRRTANGHMEQDTRVVVLWTRTRTRTLRLWPDITNT